MFCAWSPWRSGDFILLLLLLVLEPTGPGTTLRTVTSSARLRFNHIQIFITGMELKPDFFLSTQQEREGSPLESARRRFQLRTSEGTRKEYQYQPPFRASSSFFGGGDGLKIASWHQYCSPFPQLYLFHLFLTSPQNIQNGLLSVSSRSPRILGRLGVCANGGGRRRGGEVGWSGVGAGRERKLKSIS